MRLDPAVTLIMTLFALMLGATSVSAFWGYTLGRQALGGITQPDIRRTNQSDRESASHSDATQERGVLKSEDDILAQVTAKMQGNVRNEVLADFQSGGAEAPETIQSESLVLNETDDSSTAVAVSNADVSFVNYQQSLPLLTENRQVVLAVTSVRRQGNILRMGVSLQNTGDRSVEFLYSLMDVLDEQGQPLSVSTDGLPQEIPPTGETFEGAITVPSVLLGTSSTLSLRLTDYPNQQVELRINDIPVTR